MSPSKSSFSETTTSPPRNTRSPQSSQVYAHHSPHLSDNHQTNPAGMDSRCQCSQVTSNTPPLAPFELQICRCTECRRQSSTVFGITAIFPYFDLPDPMSTISLGVYTPHARSSANGGHIVQELHPKASESLQGSSASPMESGRQPARQS